MTWTLWQPAKIVNVQATLVEGGSLAANTTYYIRVQALDSGVSTRRQPYYAWDGAHILGPYSDVVQVTTTGTHRSIALEWDRVYKRDGATEVDAYEVLMATDPAQFAVENASLRCAPYGYRAPTTYTNSYTIASPTTEPYRRIPDGVPLITWDGNGPATFEGLYDWLTANDYAQFVQALSSPGGDAPRMTYHFLGQINIAPEVGGGYALTMEKLNVTVFGGLNVLGCRVKWKNSFLNILVLFHGGGTSLLYNAAGSTVEGTAIWSGLAQFVLQSNFGRGWTGGAPGFLPPGTHERFRANLLGYGLNTAIDLLQSQPVLRPDTGGGIRSAVAWKTVMQRLAQGQHLVSAEYVGNIGYPSFCMELVNNYEWWQFPGGELVDCVTNAADYQGKTGVTFNRYVSFSNYYGKNAGNRTTTIRRRLKILVLDENSAPLPGARIYVTGSGGQNLVVGYSEQDLTYLIANAATDGRNWQRSETTVKHDDADVWLYKNTSQGSTTPVAGQTYWILSERLRLIERLQVDGNWEKWRTERGLTNTVVGWLVSNGGDSVPVLTLAPDYHTTDAAGEAWNIVPLLVYKHAYDNPDWTGWLLDVPSNVGTLTFYTPITVRVEADGYRPWEATYSLELLEVTGVKPFVIVAQMQPVEPPVIVHSTLSVDWHDDKLEVSLSQKDVMEVDVRQCNETAR